MFDTAPTHRPEAGYRQPWGATSRLRHSPSEVRCECQVCGAHAYAMPGVQLAKRCGNCGSFDLIPLDLAREIVRPRERMITPPPGAALPDGRRLAVA